MVERSQINVTLQTLAPLVGGTYVPPNPDHIDGLGSIKLTGLDLNLSAYSAWNDRDKVRFQCSYNVRPKGSPYGDKYKFPEASCNVTRAPEAIAKDIARRVIEPALEVKDLWAAYVDTENARKAQMAETLKRLSDAFPGASAEPDETGSKARFWYQGHHMTVSADGSVYLSHLSLDADKAIRLIGLLVEKKGNNG